MPVVNVVSNLFPDHRLDQAIPDPAVARGRSICATFEVANLSTDSNLSTYKLCDIPADAILDSRTQFKVDTWGYADIRIGTLASVGALVSVLRSAGANVSPVAFGATAFHGKPIWQALGLAAMPANGIVTLYAHAIAAPTVAGTMRGEVHYRFH